jgi:hypothetical protein
MDEKKRKFTKEVILLIVYHFVFLTFGIVYSLFWIDIARDHLIALFHIKQMAITERIRIMSMLLNTGICIISFAFSLSLLYINFKFPAKISRIKEE